MGGGVNGAPEIENEYVADGADVQINKRMATQSGSARPPALLIPSDGRPRVTNPRRTWRSAGTRC